MNLYFGGVFISAKLNPKEKLFCYYFIISNNPQESAIKSGFSSPSKNAIKLLQLPKIKSFIQQISSSNYDQLLSSFIIKGFERIAFGSINDSVSLILNHQNLSPSSINNLDLFNISEIKKSKDGGFEIKFFDRLKALEKLSSLSSNNSSSSDFLDALHQSISSSGISHED